MPTRIRYCSDLHLEIPGNQYVPEFITGIEGEVMVFAGDTICADHLRPMRTDADARSGKKLFTQLVEQTRDFDKVVFIMGNHEHYRGNIFHSKELMQNFLYSELKVPRQQYHVLENEFISINDDTILLGTTLWTDMGKDNPISHQQVGCGMNDYFAIEVADGQVLTTQHTMKAHEIAVDYIRQVADYHPSKKIVVATHHCPSYRSEDGVHVGSTITDGYCSDLSDLILDNSNIVAWICGHTHADRNYEIGDCQVRTFQRGYVSYNEARKFDSKEFIERFIEV